MFFDYNEFLKTIGGTETFNYWALLVVFAMIFIALLLANLLIKTIKPLKKALVPAPVLGGFLLLIFLSVFKAITGENLVDSKVLEIITYHGLGIGFVASSLKKKTKKDEAEKKNNGKAIINSSFVTVGGYLIQAIIGLIVSVGLYFVVKAWPASGVLVPMGYGQGPGQALIWGSNYQNLTEATSEFGSFFNGASFGLAIAAMGFVSASVGGVFYLANQRRKGNKKFLGHDDEKELKEELETFTSANEIPSSGSIDKLSVQVGLVVLTYGISYALIAGISALCDLSGVKILINTIKPLFWGFNFIVGTGVAVLVASLLKRLETKKVIKKTYINNYMMDRISGVAFDVMVVAAIGSINLEAFKEPSFILPLIIMSVLACVGTYIYCKKVCFHLYEKDGYAEESFLAMYGMLTGTASTGVILLREIDPEFKTPACGNMVFQSLWSVIFGAPVLLLMSTVAEGWTKLIIVFAIFVVYFVVMLVLIYRDKIFKKKKAT